MAAADVASGDKLPAEMAASSSRSEASPGSCVESCCWAVHTQISALQSSIRNRRRALGDDGSSGSGHTKHQRSGDDDENEGLFATERTFRCTNKETGLRGADRDVWVGRAGMLRAR